MDIKSSLILHLCPHLPIVHSFGGRIKAPLNRTTSSTKLNGPGSTISSPLSTELLLFWLELKVIEL